MIQLDLFAPPPAPPVSSVLRVSHTVQTRAAQHGGIITVYTEDDPEPFELTVRGVECVASWSGGFCTHAIGPAGSPFWSETGFRSFGVPTLDTDEIEAIICDYIDRPAKAYGCGGKLVRWWPGYVLQWRQSLGFEIEMTKQYKGREGVWGQWGPEAWADHWHRHDMKLQDALDQMREEGIDPNDVGPPRGFNGKWPKFERIAA
ncbi:hypothetical protein [Sphingobium sp. TCM1]|uniref:hypothetical protein n=1 Tax=Sphingobium sp. TCM1 TaxID=453246 RepID=UPI0007F4FA43|nr:hypothetical protein [Sphingobium sp. TCM1]OAN56912.1 hypothetical protein A7Q26_17600 [Sphingobium sp. TCM1]